MKITAFVSTTLALAAFSVVNCAAENTDKTAPEKDQHVYLLRELSSRPTPIKSFDPDSKAFNRHESNFALVSLIVETDGSAGDVKLEQSSSPQFGKLALEAAKKWEFKPGQYKGKSVRSRVTIPFKTN